MSRTDEEKDVSLRDELISAFESSSDREETEAPNDGNEPITEVESPGEPSDGAADPAPPEAEEAEGEKPSEESEAKQEEKEKPIDPPARWTKEEKEQFAGLDPKVQRILANRNKGLEADYTRKMMELSQERQRYQGLEKALGPHRESWQRAGMTDEQALGSIMGYWDLAQRDPQQFIETFARERNMDLRSMYAPSTDEIMQLLAEGGDDDVPNGGARVDPQTRRQLDELAEQNKRLQQEIVEQRNYLMGQAQTQQQAVYQQAEAELQQFASATDESGSPRYPFLEDVRSDMARLIQAGVATTLEDAYNKATRVRDDVWGKLQETNEIRRRREDEERRREEAARAKRAGASVSGTTSTPAPPPREDDDSLSLRALIERQFSAANADGRRV